MAIDIGQLPLPLTAITTLRLFRGNPGEAASGEAAKRLRTAAAAAHAPGNLTTSEIRAMLRPWDAETAAAAKGSLLVDDWRAFS